MGNHGKLQSCWIQLAKSDFPTEPRREMLRKTSFSLYLLLPRTPRDPQDEQDFPCGRKGSLPMCSSFSGTLIISTSIL